jgi:hypothetical protein
MQRLNELILGSLIKYRAPQFHPLPNPSRVEGEGWVGSIQLGVYLWRVVLCTTGCALPVAGD